MARKTRPPMYAKISRWLQAPGSPLAGVFFWCTPSQERRKPRLSARRFRTPPVIATTTTTVSDELPWAGTRPAPSATAASAAIARYTPIRLASAAPSVIPITPTTAADPGESPVPAGARVEMREPHHERHRREGGEVVLAEERRLPGTEVVQELLASPRRPRRRSSRRGRAPRATGARRCRSRRRHRASARRSRRTSPPRRTPPSR